MQDSVLLLAPAEAVCGGQFVHGGMGFRCPRAIMIKNPLGIAGLPSVKPPLAVIDQVKILGELYAAWLVVRLQAAGPQHLGNLSGGQHNF